MRANLSSTQLRGVTNLAVLAPIRDGFIDGFETITYVERLHKLLKALNNARLYVRQAAPQQPVFPDAIGRFGIIHGFRYAIVPRYGDEDDAVRATAAGPHQLSLNVTFDGGFEPYMRVIYRDIGTLLDALFCHSPDYPGSKRSSFDTYCDWVRQYELSNGLDYVDSAMTLGDQAYLEKLERLQREARDPLQADRDIAKLSIPPTHELIRRARAAARADPRQTAAVSLRALKGLYRLAAYFPRNAAREDLILLRFTREVLGDFATLVDEGLFTLHPDLPDIARAFANELAWLRSPLPPKDPPPAPTFSASSVQAGIVTPYAGTTHGCLVFLRVADAALAVPFLAAFPVSVEGQAPGALRRNLAFTHAGLQALGMPAARRDLLPREFVEGMQARAGLLGDVRGNHPDHWLHPLRNWPPAAARSGDRFDLSLVHVVVQMRLADAANPSAELHPGFSAAINALAQRSGLEVLGVEATRSWREASDTTLTREHFGFLDGLSQPQVVPPALPRDVVPAGEIVVGYRNGRVEGPVAGDSRGWLDDGSFLVVRKLRQYVDRLNDVLSAQTKPLPAGPAEAELQQRPLLEKMMGRRMNGTPLVRPPGGSTDNDFDYSSDPDGQKCPFHSHVRRANARDGRPYMPRLARRGMSYGPRVSGPADRGTDRGIVFMAYCGSIAEQFEVLQRWIAGGNSTGVSSSQADPILGVPEPGDDRRTFRCIDDAGHPVRVDLGPKAFVELQWGLYLFAPSPACIRDLVALTQPLAPTAPPAADFGVDFDSVRAELESPLASRAEAAWRSVRARDGGVRSTHYGLLTGSSKAVCQVLADKDGASFSVAGYGQRMGASIGLGYLGQDAADPERVVAKLVNPLIFEIDERAAFTLARPIVDGVIAEFVRLTSKLPSEGQMVTVDLLTLSESVMTALCMRWFGMPDKKPDGTAPQPLMFQGGRNPDSSDTPVRCPGHLLTTSRYVFAPRPNAAAESEGQAQGAKVLEAFKTLVARGDPTKLGTLGAKIAAALAQPVPGARPDLLARTLAGVMLGFPPTVHGNFARVVGKWIDNGDLWRWQRELNMARDGKATNVTEAFDRAYRLLKDPLLQTMRERPVPEMIWRTARPGVAIDGKLPIDDDRRVVLGLASALAETGADAMLMFGGDYANTSAPPHACSGRRMAVGVLLALLSGLVEAGTLRPSGSQIQLTLIPPVPGPVPGPNPGPSPSPSPSRPAAAA
jgi:Dyp-type peroxidase family